MRARAKIIFLCHFRTIVAIQKYGKINQNYFFNWEKFCINIIRFIRATKKSNHGSELFSSIIKTANMTSF